MTKKHVKQFYSNLLVVCSTTPLEYNLKKEKKSANLRITNQEKPLIEF